MWENILAPARRSDVSRGKEPGYLQLSHKRDKITAHEREGKELRCVRGVGDLRRRVQEFIELS